MNSRIHDDDALWSAYLDGTLDPEARARAEARLRTSAADREALESMRAADAQLRATTVPDPGAAYWRDFAARVEVRVQPRDPARIYEKLVAWFVQGERVRWMRAAGALAGLTLVTYIGMRGFRPAEVQMRSAPRQVQISPPQPPVAPNPPPAMTGRKPVEIGPVPTPDVPSRGGSVGEAPSASALRDAPQEASEGKPAEERGSAGSLGVVSKPRTDQDDAASQKLEAERAQPPAPSAVSDAVPPSRARLEETNQPPGAFAPEPQLGIDPFGKSADHGALKVDLQGAGGRSATDSIASFLARSLRKDSAPSAFGLTTREAVKSLNQSKRANEAPKLPAATPQPQPEVDRLLQLADIAERFETEPQFRPHLETIATRLEEFAREDARAAARARALMRKLAASSTTPGERATWEERLRQLPN